MAQHASENSRKRLARFPLLAFAAALLLFLVLIGKQDIVTSHEGRVVQTAREMAASGWPWEAVAAVPRPDVQVLQSEVGARLISRYDTEPLRINPWLAPTMNGELRLQKPPLPYWCTAVLFSLLGFGEGVARFIPALLGACATLLLYDLARTLMGKTAARAAALVWISTFFILEEYRKAMADPYLAFFTLLCIWAWVAASRRPKNRRGGLLMLFYVSMALSILAKVPGNLATVIPGLVLFHLCYRIRAPRNLGWHLLGLIVLLVLTLPWAAYVVGRVPNAIDVWRFETTRGLVGEEVHNAEPFWLYSHVLFRLALPWTPVWVIGMAYPFLRGRRLGRQRKLRLGFPALWIVVVALLFSLWTQKKPTYLLPLMPAIVLAIARPLADLVALARLRRLKGWPGMLISIQTIIAGGMVVALIVVPFIYSVNRGVVLMIAVGMLAITVAALFCLQKPRKWMVAVTIVYALAIFAHLNYIEPAKDREKSFKPVARVLGRGLDRPDISVARPMLAADAAVYLPTSIRYRHGVSPVIVIIDDKNGEAPQTLDFLGSRIPTGRPMRFERIEGLPPSKRWKVFRVEMEY